MSSRIRQHEKFSPAIIDPLPALIAPLPVKRLPNKLAPKVPKNSPKTFCSFSSFFIVSLILFINCSDSSSRDFS